MAVSLSEGGPSTAGAAPVEESAAPRPSEEWLDRSRRTVAELLDGDMVRTVTNWFTGGAQPSTADAERQVADQTQEEVYGQLPPGLRTVDVMRLSLDALQSVVTRYRLAGYPPDLLVTVPRDACRTLDFHRAGEMIELGRTRAVEALDGVSSFIPKINPSQPGS